MYILFEEDENFFPIGIFDKWEKVELAAKLNKKNLIPVEEREETDYDNSWYYEEKQMNSFFVDGYVSNEEEKRIAIAKKAEEEKKKRSYSKEVRKILREYYIEYKKTSEYKFLTGNSIELSEEEIKAFNKSSKEARIDDDCVFFRKLGLFIPIEHESTILISEKTFAKILSEFIMNCYVEDIAKYEDVGQFYNYLKDTWYDTWYNYRTPNFDKTTLKAS